MVTPDRESRRAPPARARWLGALAFAIFALSGAAGLVYQSIWSQYLGLFLGHAAYAQSLVLAVFMGGMAGGAWWASRLAPRWANLLRGYAWVEIAIGLAALVFHREFLLVTGLAYDHAFPALASPALVAAFKWLCGAALIVPQAVLLGMTFPLMSNGLMRRLGVGDGAILSGLYFTNSIGAAIGALVATFALLPAVGLPGAMVAGAVCNLAAGGLAFALSPNAEPHAPSATDARGAADGERLFLIAAFVTGATSFVYEIGWVRMLSLALGTTVHAFELMLAAFIGGLAFGGLWIRKRIDGYRDAALAAGYVQLLMGLAALASLLLYDHTFDWVAVALKTLSSTSSGYTAFNVVSALVSIAIMAPTAFFAGMTLPLFTLALIRSGGGEASVGRVYAANTIGAIVGVFAAVHLMIPLLGLKLGMILSAAGDLALGVVLLRLRSTNPIARALALLVSGAALALTLVAARFAPERMASGVFRHGQPTVDEKILFYRDGKTASVAIIGSANGTLSLTTNGKPDASLQMRLDQPIAPDELAQVLLAALPLAYHDAPKSMAVIGFGSGMTSQVALEDPRVQSLDTIEIEPAIVAAAHAFGARVDRALNDPRSHVRFEDAKAYFASQQSKYDVIVSEPSNPWVSGVASLFTQEFYAFAARHLERGGVFVQWLQLYEIDGELAGTVVNALSTAFPDYVAYIASDSDLILVARADGAMGDPNDAIFAAPELKAALARVGIRGREELEFHRLGDRAALAPLFAAFSERRNSDFRPILSLEAPRARFMRVHADSIWSLLTADLPLLSAVGADRQPSENADLARAPWFSRVNIRAQARRIAAALSGETSELTGFGGELGGVVAYVRSYAKTCGKGGDADVAISSLLMLASVTGGALDDASREKTWAHTPWVACERLPEPVGGVLDVIRALAMRDYARVRASATTVLAEHGGELAPGAADFVFRAASVAALADHDYAGVVELDETLGRQVPPIGSTLSQRAYVLAYAKSKLEETNGAAR